MGELNIVVLGDGLLGTEIVKQTKWSYLSRKKDNIEFTSPGSYFCLLSQYDTILNCIAHTDTYSPDKDKHWNINYKYVVELARFCKKHCKKLIHISTDYVYANNKLAPSEEDAPVHAENWYSYTKLLGDAAVQLESKNNLVLRCTHKPTPFPYDEAWDDHYGNFDYVDVIANLIIKSIYNKATGVYNIGTPRKNMYELALRTNKNVKKGLTPANAPKNVLMKLHKLNIFNER
jgi:dTDP-4-dehydrorhamnose reductase